MAEFDILANIRGRFDQLKKQARDETLEFDTGGRGRGGGGGATAGAAVGADVGATAGTGGGLMGVLGTMVGLLATIGAGALLIQALLEVFQPVVDMISGIFKILALFLLPTMLRLMPILSVLMRFLSKALRFWLAYNDILNSFMDMLLSKLGDLIGSILTQLKNLIFGGATNAQRDFQRAGQKASNVPILGQTGLLDFGGYLLSGIGNQLGISGQSDEAQGNNQTNINVQGITDEGTMRRIQWGIKLEKEDSLN